MAGIPLFAGNRSLRQESVPSFVQNQAAGQILTVSVSARQGPEQAGRILFIRSKVRKREPALQVPFRMQCRTFFEILYGCSGQMPPLLLGQIQLYSVRNAHFIEKIFHILQVFLIRRIGLLKPLHPTFCQLICLCVFHILYPPSLRSTRYNATEGEKRQSAI